MENTEGGVDGCGSAAEPGVCGAAGCEFDGERVVLFADWEGWWVIFLSWFLILERVGYGGGVGRERCGARGGEEELVMGVCVDACFWALLTSSCGRIEPHGPDHKFVGVSVYGVGGVVGGGQGYIQRYTDPQTRN